MKSLPTFVAPLGRVSEAEICVRRLLFFLLGLCLVSFMVPLRTLFRGGRQSRFGRTHAMRPLLKNMCTNAWPRYVYDPNPKEMESVAVSLP